MTPVTSPTSMALRVQTLPQRFLMSLVRGYRFALSPWLGSSCRFEPTCSAYALGALSAHGALAGSALTIGRIARCQPWCDGGHDPVPARPPRLFTALLARRAAGAPAAGADPTESASP